MFHILGCQIDACEVDQSQPSIIVWKMLGMNCPHEWLVLLLRREHLFRQHEGAKFRASKPHLKHGIVRGSQAAEIGCAHSNYQGREAICDSNLIDSSVWDGVCTAGAGCTQT